MTVINTTSFRDFVQAADAARPADRILLSLGGVLTHSAIRWYDRIVTFHPVTKEENRRCWQAFQRSIEETYGRERIQRICKKYKWSLESCLQSGCPLLKKHIEMVRIGASEIFVSDLQKNREMEVKYLPLENLQAIIRGLNPFPLLKEDYSEKEIYGTYADLSELVVFDPVRLDRRKAILCHDMSQLSRYSFLERLSKSLVNKELQENTVIPVPGVNGEEDYFIVYKKICKDGLIAYGLKPLSAYSLLCPIVVFRPTEPNFIGEDAILTWLNDFQPQMGEMGYSAAKDELKALINNPLFCPETKKVDLVGYSYGGLNACMTLADNWQKVREVTCFSAPSTNKERAEEFAERINKLPVNADPNASLLFSLYINRNTDDITHYIGEKHIGWGITHPNVDIEIVEFDAVQRQFVSKVSLQANLDRHALRFLDVQEQEFVAMKYGREAINSQLDNTQGTEDVISWERARRFWSALILFPLLYAIYKVTLFLHTYLGVSSFRYTQQQKPLSSLFFSSRKKTSSLPVDNTAPSQVS